MSKGSSQDGSAVSENAMWDVFIIGAGPVGVTLANLLGSLGVSALIVDQRPELFEKPRAINLDHEVLRTFQAFGAGERVAETTVPHTGTDFRGVDDQVIRKLDPVPKPFPMGWTPNVMFIQPELEGILREHLSQYQDVALRVSTTVTQIDEAEDHVRIHLSDEKGEHSETARFVVAADGASSPTRSQLGISSTSLGFDEWWLVIDAFENRLAGLPPRITQFCNPSGPGAYVIGPGRLRRFELKLMPSDRPEEFNDETRVRDKLKHFADPDALEIWRSAAYRFHSTTADRWRSSRVFLAGDAAHQMPPHLGQGMCSGIRDAASLAWRLEGVLRGRLDESSLDDYEAERRPHVEALVKISTDIALFVGELDEKVARVRDSAAEAEMNAGIQPDRQSIIPPLTQGLLDFRQSPLTGTLSVQPYVDRDGHITLLDDAIGRGFRVLSDSTEMLGLLDIPEGWASIGGTAHAVIRGSFDGSSSIEYVVHETGTLFSDWLASSSAHVVVVRPDGYVYGSAATTEEANELMSDLVDRVAPERVKRREISLAKRAPARSAGAGRSLARTGSTSPS